MRLAIALGGFLLAHRTVRPIIRHLTALRTPAGLGPSPSQHGRSTYLLFHESQTLTSFIVVSTSNETWICLYLRIVLQQPFKPFDLHFGRLLDRITFPVCLLDFFYSAHSEPFVQHDSGYRTSKFSDRNVVDLLVKLLNHPKFFKVLHFYWFFHLVPFLDPLLNLLRNVLLIQ